MATILYFNYYFFCYLFEEDEKKYEKDEKKYEEEEKQYINKIVKQKKSFLVKYVHNWHEIEPRLILNET